jgi:hypothetical protein
LALGLIVALAAYVSATGHPDLSPVITFRFSYPNMPTFRAASKQEQILNWNTVAPFRQVEGEVVITNRSRYAARNPGMRIELDGLGGIADQPGWAAISTENQVGIMKLQWDGGADYIIHGQWSRTLPGLDATGMFAYTEDPAFVVEIAADGFGPKRFSMPVKILDDEAYQRYSTERSDFFSELRSNKSGWLKNRHWIRRQLG